MLASQEFLSSQTIFGSSRAQWQALMRHALTRHALLPTPCPTVMPVGSA